MQNYELKFNDLLNTPVFHTFLQPPNTLQVGANDGINESNILKKKGALNMKFDDVLEFPTVSKERRKYAVRITAEEFHLNTDQASVLTLVSRWFIGKEKGILKNNNNKNMEVNENENGRKMNEIEIRKRNFDMDENMSQSRNEQERNEGQGVEEEEGDEGISDIILVHGVFGSGKSHLLASVCVLLKRLSVAASYSSSSPYSSSSSSSSSSSFSSSSSSTSLSSSSSSSSSSSDLSFDESRSTQLTGIKRSLGGGGPGKTKSTPSNRSNPSQLKFKCLLSANTNVAVDRVLVQLAKRVPRSPNNQYPEKENENENENENKNEYENENENERAGSKISTCASKDNISGSENMTISLHEHEQHLLNPVIARVGCVAKIDRYLRKHYVLQAENRTNALREITRLLKTDSDPQLTRLANDTKKMDFSNIQNKRIIDADVVGVTCASAGNVLLRDMRCHVLILDEASQMTEPLSLLPMSCAQPLRMLIVGDSKQLPPTLATASNFSYTNKEKIEKSETSKSELIRNNGKNNENASNFPGGHQNENENCTTLARTLFDRLQAIGWPCVTLRTQYRCHPVIAQVCRYGMI
jgi:AAA domain